MQEPKTWALTKFICETNEQIKENRAPYTCRKTSQVSKFIKFINVKIILKDVKRATVNPCMSLF